MEETKVERDEVGRDFNITSYENRGRDRHDTCKTAALKGHL